MKYFPFFPAAMLMILPAVLLADTVTLYPTQDAFVRSDVPYGNFGINTFLRIGYEVGFSNALIQFDLSALSGSTINSASMALQIWQSAGVMPTDNIFIARNDAFWHESTVTYENRPSFSGSREIDAPASLGWWYVDVGDFVQDFADGTYTNFGFQIYKANAAPDVFHALSSESLIDYPYLVVDYSGIGLESTTFGGIKALFGQE